MTHPVNPDTDLAPVPVHIVADSARGPNKPDQRPRNLDTRRFVVPAAGSGPVSFRVAGQNLYRDSISLFCDGGNVGIVYISDSPLPGPGIFDSAVGGAAGFSFPSINSTHELFASGTSAGDILYIIETSNDA